MIRIGVLGVGHLGRIHARLIKEIPSFELVGFVDPNHENAEKVSSTGVKRFDSMEELIPRCDAIDIITPTISHFDCAATALVLGKHVFIEKPMTQTTEEAKKLVDMAGKSNLKVQIGHIERFNPAFLAVKDRIHNPLFFESHRLSQFNPRGTDVSVVLDLMVHDIDILLSLVDSPLSRISASGVAVISDSPDIANARLEFENGAVANLTSSRISVKQMRRMRIFQKDAYLSIDFLEKKSQIFRLKGEDEKDPLSIEINMGDDRPKKYIHFEEPEIPPVNSLKMELELFAQCIEKDSAPPVTAVDGYEAIKVAHEILKKMHANVTV